MKNILITGGTGTLGKALLNRFYRDNVTVISRDEKKLVELRNKYPNVRIIVGDVRRPIRDRDHERYHAIFHCAALKHVDVGEQFPDEFFETNYVGTKNVWELGEKVGVEHFIFFSTDKAVLPVNAYGYSKGMAEKYLLAYGKPKIYRWGNIIGSRGSVVPQFIERIKNDRPCIVTDPRMTRFWLTIEEAIDFVISTYDSSDKNLLIHPTIKSAKVTDIVLALSELIGKTADLRFADIRPGEKLHECLRTGHDYCIRSDTCDMYSADELKEKLKNYI